MPFQFVVITVNAMRKKLSLMPSFFKDKKIAQED